MNMKKQIKSGLSWLGIVLIVFICSMFLQSEVFAGATVNQNSMNNTLYPNQKMIIDKLSYQFSEPERGDIIVFLKNGEKGSIADEMLRNLELFTNKFLKSKEIYAKHEMLVKRVIGVPGDVVDIRDGYVYVNGIKLIEDYAKGATYAGVVEVPVTVDENQLFVLGDNREVSIDSREFGPVNYEKLEGKAIFRIFPLNKIGKID